MAKTKQRKSSEEILMYADSENSADMFHFVRAFVADPFLAFSYKRKKIGVLSQLEINRIAREGDLDEIIPLEQIVEEAMRYYNKTYSYPASIIQWIKREFKINSFRVDQSFPFGLADALKKRRIKLNVAEGALFPEREYKTDAEARAIIEGNQASAAGFKVVEKILKKSKIKNNYLFYEGKRLSSERVQQEVLMACLKHGAMAPRIIVAGGDQGCDPHCVGHGALRANELIVVDIFPRVQKTGYYGDMTRTFLKGKATDAQKQLYHTVLDAQQWAITQFKTRKSGIKITEGIYDRFEKAGYPTEKRKGVPVGFFHGVGHGVGLDIHEAPRVNRFGSILKTNQVITVEPGLYYPGIGGVRIEDVVRVKPAGPEMLSDYHYNWIIK